MGTCNRIPNSVDKSHTFILLCNSISEIGNPGLFSASPKSLKTQDSSIFLFHNTWLPSSKTTNFPRWQGKF